MGDIKRKFYIIGVGLIAATVAALLIQYVSLDKTIRNERIQNLNLGTDHLNQNINYIIDTQILFIESTAALLSSKTWSDDEILGFFNELGKVNSKANAIFFGNADNKLIISNKWTPPSYYDLRERKWYKKTMELETTYVSDMYFDAMDSNPVIAISTPVYNDGGQVVGVVGIDVRAEEIYRIVEESKLVNMGFSFLIDGEGKLVSYPKYKSIMTTKAISKEILGKDLHTQIIETKQGRLDTSLDGVKGYLVYEPLENSDWIIVTFVSNEEFAANKWSSIDTLMSSIILSFLIFGAFLYLLIVIVIRPLSHLDYDIGKINVEADPGYRLRVDQGKPLEELRTTINKVLEKSEVYFDEREDKALEIESQNRELEASNEELTAMEEELRYQYDQAILSEEKLAEANIRNLAILEAIPDTMFIFDREGTYLDAIATEGKTFFKPKNEFLGRKITEAVRLDLAEIMLDRIQRVLDSGQVADYEYFLYEDDGRKKYFESRMVRLSHDRVLSITRNITYRKEMESKLIDLSYRDQLTGLYNRRFLEEEMARLDNSRNLPLTIVMADVNGLKLINDSFGHKAGDNLLKKVAQILQKGCREGDILSRVSGDEFILLLPNTTGSEAENIVKRIKDYSIYEGDLRIGDLDLDLSISFGFGTKTNTDIKLSEVYKKAEDNMYAHKLLEGPSMRSKTIGTIIRALYEKSNREEKHSQRVSIISQEIGKVLGFGHDKLRELESVGLVHDIGKIAIPEHILDKPGRLTEEEWNEMKRHPEIGYRILGTVDEMRHISEFLLYHHERYDGSGYPKGLKGDEIPLMSRIITIADAYDAMATERPYKRAFTEEEIAKEFIDHAGSQFDPKLARIFVEEVLKRKWEV